MKMVLIFSFFLLAACGPESEQKNNNINNGTVASNNGATVGHNTARTSNGTTFGTTGTTFGTTGTTQTNGMNNQTNTGEKVLLSEIFQAAFSDTGCVVGYCHGGAVDGLVISDPKTSIIALVNVDSIRPSCNLTKLVVPGKPEESLLWMRVRPAALETGEPCVPKMPKDSDGLDEEKAKLIYDWIVSGAKL